MATTSDMCVERQRAVSLDQFPRAPETWHGLWCRIALRVLDHQQPFLTDQEPASVQATAQLRRTIGRIEIHNVEAGVELRRRGRKARADNNMPIGDATPRQVLADQGFGA